MKIPKLIKVKKSKDKAQKTKVMAFGTFDLLHKGHFNFFKQARRLAKNPFLIVSVARDINAKRIKGFTPRNSEGKRLKIIKSCHLVDKAVLGAHKNYLSHIVKEKPSIVVLGYDQTHYTEELRSKLKNKGLNAKVVRLKPYKPTIYKTSLLRK